MNYASNSTAQEAMWGGFIPFGLCSFWGLNLLLRGLRQDILDASGHEVAPRSLFIGGGILLQLPLIGFTLFAWKQGLFGSWVMTMLWPNKSPEPTAVGACSSAVA